MSNVIQLADKKDIKVMERPTICAECKHGLFRQDGPRTGVWYNNYCTASPRKPAIDFVTGQKGYAETNVLGTNYTLHKTNIFMLVI